MHCIWDSPAWQSLGTFTSTPHNLTFSYYIDWFNPFTNKIAGRVVSCGAIMMFCLNLPDEMQRMPKYTFFAGITPPLKEPTMITITAVSDPIVERLKGMWEGRIICTHQYPLGVQKQVRVLVAIGDLLAICKAMGFHGVASELHICSFCDLCKADLEDLRHHLWTLHKGEDVL